MSKGFAVIGYGGAFSEGKLHANALSSTPGLNLVGFYDVDPSRVKQAQADFPSAKGYGSLEDLIADEQVYGAVVVTPHSTHRDIVVRLLEGGKAVVCEKPMAITAKEADDMIDASRRAGVPFTVFQNRRWDGDYLTVKSVVESGVLGPVFLYESTVEGYGEPRGWRRERRFGGGMLYDWGAHLIDQALQLVRERLLSVYAKMEVGRVWNVDVDTHSFVLMNFEHTQFMVETGSIEAVQKPRWRILGEKGGLQAEWDKARIALREKGVSVDGEVKMIKGDWMDFYRQLSRALNEGGQLPVRPEESRDAIAVIEAAFESARTGEPVKPTLLRDSA
ncbi:MAG: Gfo/Idh/MocA family oxidoreductase [TACK group archaeon]|nr:Gfo/Idh/MocA family oxidoreductase [TACK group archaeon]